MFLSQSGRTGAHNYREHYYHSLTAFRWRNKIVRGETGDPLQRTTQYKSQDSAEKYRPDPRTMLSPVAHIFLDHGQGKRVDMPMS